MQEHKYKMMIAFAVRYNARKWNASKFVKDVNAVSCKNTNIYISAIFNFTVVDQCTQWVCLYEYFKIVLHDSECKIHMDKCPGQNPDFTSEIPYLIASIAHHVLKVAVVCNCCQNELLSLLAFLNSSDKFRAGFFPRLGIFFPCQIP